MGENVVLALASAPADEQVQVGLLWLPEAQEFLFVAVLVVCTFRLLQKFASTAHVKEIARLPEKTCINADGKPRGNFSEDSDSKVCDDIELPSHPHLQGCILPNTGELLHFPNKHNSSYAFENEMCCGTTVAMHRATYDTALDRSGEYPYGYVFKGRKANWEMRMQIRFKQAPDGRINFGIELDEYVPLMGSTKAAMRAVVSSLKWIVGDELHHSPGDDPAQTSGEAERPIFSMPVFAFDQFIETPEGQEPPDITDPNFPQLGIRRADDSAAFTKTMANQKFVVGPTYTFSFWSISQLLDCLMWQIKGVIPGVTVDFDRFCGRPPIHVVMYTLKPPPAGRDNDERHLDSRKSYIFHLAFWSSLRKPPQRRLEQLLPQAAKACSDVAASPLNPKTSNKVFDAAKKGLRLHGGMPYSGKASMDGFFGCFAGYMPSAGGGGCFAGFMPPRGGNELLRALQEKGNDACAERSKWMHDVTKLATCALGFGPCAPGWSVET